MSEYAPESEDRHKDLVKSRQMLYASSFLKTKPNLPSARFNEKMRVKLDTYEVNRRGRVQTRQLTALKERAEALKQSEEDQYIDKTAQSMVSTYKRGNLLMSGTGRADDTFEIEREKIDVEASLYREIEEGYKSSDVFGRDSEEMLDRETKRIIARKIRKFGKRNKQMTREESLLHEMESTRRHYEDTEKTTSRLKLEAIESLTKVTELTERLKSKDAKLQGFGLRAKMTRELLKERKRARKLIQDSDAKSAEWFETQRHFQLYGFAPRESDGTVLSDTFKKSRGALVKILGGANSAFGSIEDVPIELHSLNLTEQVRQFEKQEFRRLAESVGGMRVDEDGNVTRDKIAIARDKLLRPVSNRRKKKRDVETQEQKTERLKREQELRWSVRGKDFTGIENVGRLITLEDTYKKREVDAERLRVAREKQLRDEKKERELASKLLQTLEIGTKEDSATSEVRKRMAKHKHESSLRLDHSVVAMGPQNITTQRDRKQTEALFGRGRIIPVDPRHLPPLCLLWVAAKCMKSGLKCRHRHYYSSAQEKDRFMEWHEQMERLLERPIVKSISMREELLIQVREEMILCRRKFESHFGDVKREDVSELMSLMNQLRVATVECTEHIHKWAENVKKQSRAHMKRIGTIKNDDDDAVKRKENKQWSVKVVVTGNVLYVRSSLFSLSLLYILNNLPFLIKRRYGKSPAFHSKDRRHCRDMNFEKKELRWMYLGVYPTEEAALYVSHFGAPLSFFSLSLSRFISLLSFLSTHTRVRTRYVSTHSIHTQICVRKRSEKRSSTNATSRFIDAKCKGLTSSMRTLRCGEQCGRSDKLLKT